LILGISKKWRLFGRNSIYEKAKGELMLENVKKIYFVGIGGIGMSGLALLLHEQGYEVLGSDMRQGSNVLFLKQRGISVFIGHDPENIPVDIDLLTYSSAVSGDNPEMVRARCRGLKIVKRGELLARLSEDKRTIAIAGSHGKTTSSSLLSYLLTALGRKPTVFVGGVPLNYNCGACWGDEYFVIETDESDGSFLHFNPRLALITNVDKEHIDHYGTYRELKNSFRRFAENTKDKVFGWGDEAFLKGLIKEVGGVSFGWLEHNRFQGRNFRGDGFNSFFDLYKDGKYKLSINLPLAGEHNCRNALGVLAVLDYLGQDMEKAATLISGFKGTKRRFQKRSEQGGVIFIDDYAHHPTEIKAVLSAARLLNRKRLFVIAQPHRFSRLRSLKEEFISCWQEADVLILTDVYAANEAVLEGASIGELFQEVKRHFSGTIEYIPKENLSNTLPAYFREGDLVLALGAGDINTVMEKVVDEFEKYRALQRR
jgi:UDP-N-acetylmuramate--alanine ligase